MGKNKAHEKFEEFLKTDKHRITPERFEVLDYALESGGHFSADELYQDMKNRNSNISRATVYNSLELLVKCGMLIKRNFGKNKSFYEST
ncbi:MAG: transcriptional repressor, partial [Bacteroidota bacterium]